RGPPLPPRCPVRVLRGQGPRRTRPAGRGARRGPPARRRPEDPRLAVFGLPPCATHRKTPAWLYWGLLADVFHAAKLGDRAIECAERAHEHAPENVTVLLDLAMSLLRHRRDVERARPLTKMAREHEISDLVLPFLYMIDGVLALEDRQPELARQKLEESVKLAEPFRHTTALMGPAIDRIHTYLSLAFAATGDLV